MPITISGSGITSSEILDGTITDSDVNTAKIVVKDASGNVDVASNSGNNLQFKITNTFGSGSAWYMNAYGADGNLYIGDTTDRLTLTGAGNMGLGVTPESGWHSTQFDVLQIGYGAAISAYTATATVKCISLSSNVYSTLGSALNGHKYIDNEEATLYHQYAGQHHFRVAPSGTADAAISWTTAMTIDNDGGVLVHRTSQSSGNNGVAFQVDANGTVLDCETTYSGFDQFRFKYSGSEVGSITISTSSTAYNTSSDYRLKENVVPMSGSIDRLKELKPSRFNFIADADKTVDGFLAHEAQAIVPECVTGEKDAMKMEDYEVTPAVKDDDDNVITEAVMGERSVPDMQGIDQAKLVPLLTSALQDAIAKIEQLESRISSLEVN
jgi:hypothetical protein